MPTSSQTQPVPDIESLAKDIAALKQDFATLIADIRAGIVGQPRTMVHEAAEQISSTASTLYGKAAAQADMGVKALAQEVDERPLTALTLAFAVGFVASRLLSR